MWQEGELPNLVTAFNTINLVKQCSLLLLVWARVIGDGGGRDHLVGQARIKLSELSSGIFETTEASQFSQVRLCLGNKQIGTVNTKVKFR